MPDHGAMPDRYGKQIRSYPNCPTPRQALGIALTGGGASSSSEGWPAPAPRESELGLLTS